MHADLPPAKDRIAAYRFRKLVDEESAEAEKRPPSVITAEMRTTAATSALRTSSTAYS